MNLTELQKTVRHDVSRETYDLLTRLVSLILDESTRQNLIATSTAEDIWNRHIIDSIQLLKFGKGAPWLDLGTGAGFPGLIIAAFSDGKTVMVEERRLRHEFLRRTVETLGLENAYVIGDKLERVDAFEAQTITARAFAPLDKIFRLSYRFSGPNTRWVLPKGKKAQEELASVRSTWHGDFRLEPSVTDPSSSIIIADNVSPKGER